jgi:hypothetical protein
MLNSTYFLGSRPGGVSCSLGEIQVLSSVYSWKELCLSLSGRAQEGFVVFCFVFLSVFDSTRVWTQGFMITRQALYHFSHASSPFSPGYFGARVLLLVQTCLEPPTFHFILLLDWH